MNYQHLKALTTDQETAVRRLTAACAEADGAITSAETEADPMCEVFFYLAEDDTDIPAAFLSCFLFKDGETVLPQATFTLHVRPDLRRQGLAKELFRQMICDCKALSGTKHLHLNTCASPHTPGHKAALAMGFAVAESHLLMHLSMKDALLSASSFDSKKIPHRETADPIPAEDTCSSPYVLKPCYNRRILASLYHRIFRVPLRAGRIVIEELLDMPEVDPFVLFHGKQAIGLAMLLDNEAHMYLFNLGMLPELRRQGLATYMFSELLEYVPEQTQALQLQVDRGNLPALKLYEKLGFRIVTELLEMNRMV